MKIYGKIEVMKSKTIKEIKTLLETITSPHDPIFTDLFSDSRKGVQSLLVKKQADFQYLKDLQENKNRMLQYEKEAWSKGFQWIAGIDEVGRGPLAGPVVTCAVILPPHFPVLGIKDSKKLSHLQRVQLVSEIEEHAAAIGYGIRTAEEIDQMNILQATKQAMLEALNQLEVSPDLILVDAEHLDTPLPQKSLIKGDDTSYSIACASILAKEKRDDLMKEYAKIYPEFGFEKHAGYGTKAHLQALEAYGPTPIHRKSFAPVKRLIK